MTLSIVARSPDAQLFGAAIASSSPAVAARCVHGRAGIGMAATQNLTDPALGPRILDALGRGFTAQAALDESLAATPFGAHRQLLAIGRSGPAAVHSGARCLGLVSAALGADAGAAGNLLANVAVPGAMTAAFGDAKGHLGDRLMQALRAGLDRGGEAGPLRSAGLLIVREMSWPIVDLRVDWSEDDPVATLAVIWRLYSPQIDDYVQRAVDPTRAPRFGVPGDAEPS
jgi:uncharacterized Ntn-hydrolase superfamily protein